MENSLIVSESDYISRISEIIKKESSVDISYISSCIFDNNTDECLEIANEEFEQFISQEKVPYSEEDFEDVFENTLNEHACAFSLSAIQRMIYETCQEKDISIEINGRDFIDNDSSIIRFYDYENCEIILSHLSFKEDIKNVSIIMNHSQQIMFDELMDDSYGSCVQFGSDNVLVYDNGYNSSILF